MNLYYDTNPFNTGFAQNTWGRLALAEYFLSPYRITEAYSYTASGRMQKKRLYENYAHSGSWPNRLAPPQSLDSIPNYLYLEAIYNYNDEGQVTSMTYPSSYEYPSQWVNGRTYTYEFDSLGRPNKLTDNQATVWAKDLVYGPANERKEMKYLQGFNGATPQYLQETNSFNARLQRTQLQTVQSWNGVTLFNTQYVYSATQNNGQILQSVDAVSGETVDYAYDSLNRLIAASTTGPQWGLGWSYDGFGNRLSQTVTKGSGPASSLTINAASNRISTTGYGYDNNGNLTTMPQGGPTLTLSYDSLNRVSQLSGAASARYGYDPQNRRTVSATTAYSYDFYGAFGERLGTFKGGGTFFRFSTNLYFNGKLISTRLAPTQGGTPANEQAIVMDRLGSVRVRTKIQSGSAVTEQLRYYPYGEEIGSATANDKDKFATYYRDSSTGLDYALNRYYGSNLGRFLMPDPYRSSRRMENPSSSWNQYAYVSNDPVNWLDPLGLDEIPAGTGVIPRADFLPGPIPSPGGGVPGGGGEGRRGGDGPDERAPGGDEVYPPSSPSPRGTVPFKIDGLEIRIECGDGHLLGIGVQLTGPSSARIGDLYEIPANTIAAVKVEQDGKIVIGSSNPISYDGPGPWNAHVSRFTFNKDGTYHSSDISLDYGPDRAAEFFLRRELRKVSNMTNVISQIPSALAKIGDLPGICR